MKRKTIALTAITAAFILSVGCATAYAAEPAGATATITATATTAVTATTTASSTATESYSYLTGQQRSVRRNELYAQAEQLPEEERDAFLAENGIGDTPYSEEAAAFYSYVTGQQRGASYRQSDDSERAQDTTGYSYLVGQKRGASYLK